MQSTVSKPTIKNYFVQQLLAVIKNNAGTNLLALPDEIKDKISQSATLSVSEVNQLIIAIQQALDDEMLGLFNKKVPIGSFPVILKAVRYQPNALSVIEWINEYYTLYNEGAVFQIEKYNNKVVVLLNNNIEEALMPIYCEVMFISLYKTLCHLCRTNFPLHEVALPFCFSGADRELHYLFACENIIESSQPYICFDAATLQLPVYADPVPSVDSLYTYFMTWVVKNDLGAKIREVVEASVPLHFPSKTQLASGMNISVQTLGRRLKESGLTYQEIKDDIRRDRAVTLLLNPAFTIKKIALDLGFNEPAAFNKTFKKWFSLTPTQYREKLLS